MTSVRRYSPARKMAPKGKFSSGPAGPVVHIDPATINAEPPAATKPKRSMRRKHKLRKRAASPAVIAHQNRPYTPPT